MTIKYFFVPLQMNYIELLSGGAFTTIQDRGRVGYRSIGVPTSGAMDQRSMTIGNLLLNNSADDSVLEMTLIAPKILFHADSLIAISGADLSPSINGVRVRMQKALVVTAGDVLSFGDRQYGFRSYLVIKGGFQSPIKMNSRSQYQNITKQPRLMKGDRIDYVPYDPSNGDANSLVSINRTHFESKMILVTKGPEYDWFPAFDFAREFSVASSSNRMAVQMNERISHDIKREMITSAVLPGTVQLTPSGQVNVLMRDGQTTGGYPRILQLTEASIDILSQKSFDDRIYFKMID